MRLIRLILVFALLAGPALAARAPAPAAEAAAPKSLSRDERLAGPSIIAPAWRAEPSLELVAGVFPSLLRARGSGGFAVLSCVVADAGVLNDCMVMQEEPLAVRTGSAAVSLMGLYRSDKPKGSLLLFPVVFDAGRPKASSVETGDTGLIDRLAEALSKPDAGTSNLTIIGCQVNDAGQVQTCALAYQAEPDGPLADHYARLAKTAAYPPVPPLAGAPLRTLYQVFTDNTDRPRAVMANAPTPEAFYPAKATGAVIGEVRLNCTVHPDGLAKDCEVVSETPKEMGFASAALQYAGRATFLPKRLDGELLVDPITLDVRLSPGQEATLAAQAAAEAEPAPSPPPPVPGEIRPPPSPLLPASIP